MTEVSTPLPPLSQRQRAVLRAMVTSYVGEAAPIGSGTLAQVLPTRVSSATIRATLGELAELGLVTQPHTSAGRVPTQDGLRFFIDELLDTREVADHDRRTIAFRVDDTEVDSLVPVAAELLSESTRQLGFVAVPALDRVVLQHVSLVRLTTERVLAILVSSTGTTYRRVLRAERDLPQPDLDRIAAVLNERVMGQTLGDMRDALAREAHALRRRADRLLIHAIALAQQALSVDEEMQADLVIATRLALLDQPEFQDPGRLREVFRAVETKERLLEVLDDVLSEPGVSVVLGGEIEEPSLQRCALVATRYGGRDAPSGVLGVIGPSRMDYARVIPLVGYFSDIVTEKLQA